MLSVIIPAYNEEKRLPRTLEKVRDYLDRQNITYEVIVVNDGSSDDTSEVLHRLIKDWDGFRLIDNKINQGKGGGGAAGNVGGQRAVAAFYGRG